MNFCFKKKNKFSLGNFFWHWQAYNVVSKLLQRINNKKIWYLLTNICYTENKFIIWSYSFSCPISNFLFESSNNNCRIKCKTCSNLTIEAPHIFLLSLLLTLNIFDTFFCFCWLWICKCQIKYFFPSIYLFICISEDLGALLHLRRSSLQQSTTVPSYYLFLSQRAPS